MTSVKDKVKLMCPYYDQLSEIFGEKAWSNEIVLQSSVMVFDEETSVQELNSTSEQAGVEIANSEEATPFSTIFNADILTENTVQQTTTNRSEVNTQKKLHQGGFVSKTI
ncbi:uncharacterized protein LOC119673414 [Teleopsis dalmanni]|uniref:uncharacterized protein LOC119662357 n=1 Tax=Teleopsis dalmanni TaxID=139649 RepID=UPI0018CD4423|nr:uncharacterized protein LOC119662357 [Teleopsis dalmanni]XP_037940180.1 uncharacterized protein LOC119673039 [Teleopsis dalmanni]XP_037940613.1 uncharacterized protein LOC119673414 [Teleopsis dalmanni]